MGVVRKFVRKCTTLPFRFGAGENYTEIDIDGSVRHFGEATVFDDVVQSVSATNLYGTPGKADYDFTNLWAVLEESGSLSTAGDCIFVNYQIPHAAIADGIFRLHMHWSQSSNTVRTISGKYRIQNNGAGGTTAWQTFSATTAYGGSGGNIFDTTDWNYGTGGNFNQITRLVDIPLTGLGVSAIIQVVVARTDANAGSDLFLLSMDGHIEKDATGSRQEYEK